MKTRINKGFAFLLSFLFIFSLPLPTVQLMAKPQTTPPTLKNIGLMEEERAGWGVAVTEDGTREGETVYKIAPENGGAYGVMFIPNSWAGFSLRDYEANGVLTFDIKGEKGGEDFTVAISSFRPGKGVTQEKTLDALGVKITADWTRHSIPLKNLIEGAPKDFTLDNVTELRFNADGVTFYISSLYISSPDEERQYAIIKPNQVGYAPESAKYAMVSYFPGRGVALSAQTAFEVVNAATGAAAYKGNLVKVKDKDLLSGENVYKAVFDGLKAEGQYLIRISGVPDSYKFSIKKDIYADVLRDALKYYYYQRQGMELTKEYAGAFQRKDLHPGDSQMKLLSQHKDKKAATYDMSGGWYDAGGFDQQVTAASGVVMNLLFAYELFPDLFYDGQSHIPESGKDGLPDILSELKYELDFFFKMEKGTTGGFYEFITNEDEADNRWGFSAGRYILDLAEDGKTSTPATGTTLSVAAAMAHAYIVFKDIPGYEDYAEKCLSAARRAWAFVQAQNGTITQPYEDIGGGPLETDQKLLWAAGTLYRATGDTVYGDYFKENHHKLDVDIFNGWGSLPYQSFVMGGYFHYLMAESPDAGVKAYFTDKYRPYRDFIYEQQYTQANGWGIVLPEWAYWWSSTSIIGMGAPLTFYIGNKITGDLGTAGDKSAEMAQNAINYMLGANPLAFSFVSGHGTDSLKYIHSGIYNEDGIDAMPRGIVPGGADSTKYGFMTHFPAKAYIDSSNYEVNEHSVGYQAAFIACLALAMEAAAE